MRRFCWSQGHVAFFVPIIALVSLGVHPLCLWGTVTVLRVLIVTRVCPLFPTATPGTVTPHGHPITAPPHNRTLLHHTTMIGPTFTRSSALSGPQTRSLSCLSAHQPPLYSLLLARSSTRASGCAPLRSPRPARPLRPPSTPLAFSSPRAGFVSLVGFPGVPLAHVVSQYTLLLLLAAYVCCCRHRRPPYDPRTWTGWQLRRAFRGGAVVEFLKLGVPGILSNSEWWFWECTCFMAGELGTASLAAHTVVYTLVPLLFMTPLGLSIGISARVGQLLAEGKVEDAKMVNRAATLIGVAAVTAQAIVFFAASDAIIGAFTQDEAVACKCRRIWPLACSYIIFDGTFGVQMGTMRALGLQCRMTVAVTSSLWLIGLPTMYVNRWAESEKDRDGEKREREREREVCREKRDRDHRETTSKILNRQLLHRNLTGDQSCVLCELNVM